MISDTRHELARLGEEIEVLRSQLASMAGLRQAAIRKTREHIQDAIFVLTEEQYEIELHATLGEEDEDLGKT